MKTHTIKTPTAELLILEMPKCFKDYSYKKPLLEVRGDEPNLVEFLSLGRYELLGKPDEISEEDAAHLVEQIRASYSDGTGGNTYFKYYNTIRENVVVNTAKESLLSLIESEIYWENPLANEIHAPDIEEWREAEQKTFDRNRTLIFVKNNQ